MTIGEHFSKGRGAQPSFHTASALCGRSALEEAFTEVAIQARHGAE